MVVESLDLVTNNLTEILYQLHYNIKLDTKNQEHKNLLTKTRMTLRDLHKIKNTPPSNLLAR